MFTRVTVENMYMSHPHYCSETQYKTYITVICAIVTMTREQIKPMKCINAINKVPFHRYHYMYLN